jgi:hypothetical protein
MKPFALQEVEQLRDQTYLYRALKKVLLALNLIVGTLTIGTATLVAGTVTVKFSGLTTDSRIVTCHQTIGGTAGHLSVDTANYNLAAYTFKINSSSASDTSVVTWLHWA